MNNTATIGNAMFYFRFAVVYHTIYAFGHILTLLFLFFFQNYIFRDHFGRDMGIFSHLFASYLVLLIKGRFDYPIIFLNISIKRSSNNYLKPSVLGNYLNIPLRYIGPQSPVGETCQLRYRT